MCGTYPQTVPIEFSVVTDQAEVTLERAWTSVGTSSQICGSREGSGIGVRVSVEG